MTRQAAIYVRISHDPSGQRLGVTRQRKDCERKAKERGWDVARIFEDNDVSASTGRRRPGYQAMLSAIRDETISAVVVWDLDRLTRRPLEIEEFIELADTHRVDLASVGGDVDLSTDNGRLFARIKGAVARAEIERKTARQKAANSQRREHGIPHAGRRSFGYSADGMTIIEAEAEAIQRMAAELLAGVSVREMTKRLNEAGFTTTAGNPWKPTEARRLIARPRLAGLLAHGGEVIGAGSWPAILDEDTHRAIVGILADPARHKAGRPTSYLLSGIAECGVCGARTFGSIDKRKGYGSYRCETRKHIHRRAEPIDDYIAKVIVGRLGRPDALAVIKSKTGVSPRDIRELQAEERSIRARLDGLAEAYASGSIDMPQLRAGTTRLNKRLASVANDINKAVQSPDIGALLAGRDVRASWDALTMDRRRGVIRTLLSVVALMPAGQGARSFDVNSVKVKWVGEPE